MTGGTDAAAREGDEAFRDAARLLAAVGPLPSPAARPALVALAGLPGTGKSTFARRLAERLPLVVVESDALRRVLFRRRTYSARESARLFAAIHRLIAQLLARGVVVVLDATNLTERHRGRLSRIAGDAGAKLLVVHVHASEQVVRQRLAGRGKPGSGGNSEADWAVYARMRGTFEPILQKHYAVDTAVDIEPAVRRVAEELEGWVRGGAAESLRDGIVGVDRRQG